MQKVEKARPQDLVGIYGDLAEIIGVDNAIIIYKYFKGQQVSFPTRLYSKDFIVLFKKRSNLMGVCYE